MGYNKFIIDTIFIKTRLFLIFFFFFINDLLWFDIIMLYNNINIEKPRVKIIFYQVNILLTQILTEVDFKINVFFFLIRRANFVILLLLYIYIFFFFCIKFSYQYIKLWDFFLLLGHYYLLEQYIIDSWMTCYLFLDLFKL